MRTVAQRAARPPLPPSGLGRRAWPSCGRPQRRATRMPSRRCWMLAPTRTTRSRRSSPCAPHCPPPPSLLQGSRAALTQRNGGAAGGAQPAAPGGGGQLHRGGLPSHLARGRHQRPELLAAHRAPRGCGLRRHGRRRLHAGEWRADGHQGRVGQLAAGVRAEPCNAPAAPALRGPPLPPALPPQDGPSARQQLSRNAISWMLVAG